MFKIIRLAVFLKGSPKERVNIHQHQTILGIDLSKLPRDAFIGSEDLDFKEIEENWNTYTLSDGTTIKVKLVLRGVRRLKKYEPDGTPIYIINSINVVRAVNIPEELKAKPKESEMTPV